MTARVSAIRAVFAGSLAQNRARTLLCVFAIALGVALGYAVQLINQAAIDELALGVRSLSGEADLEVRGPREGFAETLYPQLARLSGVRSARNLLSASFARMSASRRGLLASVSANCSYSCRLPEIN